MSERKHDHTGMGAVQALRGFQVRRASAITINSDGASSAPVVLCHLDTVEAVNAEHDDVPSTEHSIVVTAEVATQLAADLDGIASDHDSAEIPLMWADTSGGYPT